MSDETMSPQEFAEIERDVARHVYPRPDEIERLVRDHRGAIRLLYCCANWVDRPGLDANTRDWLMRARSFLGERT